jgi:hypothetical protein
MISYLINNIHVFFTFLYLFFHDYTRMMYPFIDSIEERINLINLALFLEKLPKNFGEEIHEKIEEENLESHNNDLFTPDEPTVLSEENNTGVEIPEDNPKPLIIPSILKVAEELKDNVEIQSQ